jgi:beta-phosphoglucomutase-like phosphatase (HAD superfamily)
MQGKPAPDVYVEALRRTGCTNPARSVVIEDTVNGLMAAKAAGAFAVGVTNSLPREVLHPHADLVVSHLSELDLATLVPDQICCPK